MDKPLPKIVYWLPGAIAGLFYIFTVIQPELYFHYQQNPFIFSHFFINTFLKYPGGIAGLISNFLMQFFYFPVVGALVLFFIISAISLLLYHILRNFSGYFFSITGALMTSILAVTLLNDYKFPLSVVVSVILVLTVLLILVKAGKNFSIFFLLFIAGSVFIYYCCGSGYLMLFSVCSVLLFPKCKLWIRVTASVVFIVFAILISGFAANNLFALPSAQKYLFFYPVKPFFIHYQPSAIFRLFIFSIPVLLIFAKIHISFFEKLKKKYLDPNQSVQVFSFLILIVSTGYFSHFSTFNSDAKKIVASDYYCYLNEPVKTAQAATTLKEYNFTANLNYNLVMSKTGRLTDNAFSFMQIKGAESLHPDIDFASDLCFIAADFYYNLGFISEAKHWAYETLVFYPYNARTMELLVKIHLIGGEYIAAERYLNILRKGITHRKFVKELEPLMLDTSLIIYQKELAEKRGFTVAEGELSPFIETRFKQLLEANETNKNAYEHLMLYYLLGNQTEKFNTLLSDCGKHFDKTPAVYEEAVLLNAMRTGQSVPTGISVSAETQDRFNRFMQQRAQFNGKTRQARNALYKEFGKTWLYFIHFVYPNIIETEIIADENDYPAI